MYIKFRVLARPSPSDSVLQSSESASLARESLKCAQRDPQHEWDSLLYLLWISFILILSLVSILIGVSGGICCVIIIRHELKITVQLAGLVSLVAVVLVFKRNKVWLWVTIEPVVYILILLPKLIISIKKVVSSLRVARPCGDWHFHGNLSFNLWYNNLGCAAFLDSSNDLGTAFPALV